MLQQIRMAGQKITVPFPIVIKEEPSDEEEVHCRLCHKAFATDVALRNHARMDHMETYAKGDPTLWTKSEDDPVVISKCGQKKEYKVVMHKRKHDTQSLTDLAANNIGYVVIKANQALLDEKRQRTSKKDGEGKRVSSKRSKSPQAITGPFECVEPSSLGIDGTCHQIFFSCCAYSQHLRTEHTRRRKAARCQVCERPLPAPNHGGDPNKPYACETCGEAFATSEELHTHTTREHVKVKAYECSVCKKRFTQQGGVMQHMRMHSGDRPFPCTFCNKAFTQKSGLDQHTRTHTKVKPYRCVVCSKSFIQSVHLKQHMRTHTNLTPFQCGICDKRFKQSSHLNYHLRNHNPVTLTSEQRKKYNALVGKIFWEKDAKMKQNNLEQGLNVEQYGIVEQEEYVEQDGNILQEVVEHEDSEVEYVEQDGNQVQYVDQDGAEVEYVGQEGSEVEYVGQEGSEVEYVGQEGSEVEYVGQEGSEVEFVEQENVGEDHVEHVEVEQMESGSYEVDPRYVCTVEQATEHLATEADTYIIEGSYED